jgi:hypothetical protein
VSMRRFDRAASGVPGRRQGPDPRLVLPAAVAAVAVTG